MRAGFWRMYGRILALLLAACFLVAAIMGVGVIVDAAFGLQQGSGVLWTLGAVTLVGSAAAAHDLAGIGGGRK